MIQQIRDAAIAFLVTYVIILLGWARSEPETFGQWLQTIDTARYEMTMFE